MPQLDAPREVIVIAAALHKATLMTIRPLITLSSGQTTPAHAA